LTEKYICIHGHFYQPPRENPWLEEVGFQESAYPYHDWNSRITAECYAPNSYSRIMDSQGRIIGLVNNYSKISFNFGPTLLYWIVHHDPSLYRSILEADKESMKNFSGHGSAIAQVYNHMIMPLANKHDKETQVKWGIRDFEIHYGRIPEGMWLPETAVDNETLETLAENGIKFTILGPHQALNVRKIGEEKWQHVNKEQMNTRKAYKCNLPSGKSINLFFYDGTMAASASFGNALVNGEVFANALLSKFKGMKEDVALVDLATDGELYGHHRFHADMTLAYCLHYITSNNLAKITNYSEFLEKHPPEFEVQIAENTSWSCSHGVERWKDDCGDSSGQKPGWHQAWRKPLRESMDWLRDTLLPNFENQAQEYLKDPWAARNDYVNVILDRSRQNIEKFLSQHAKRNLSEEEKKRVMKILEMQRQTMLMYASCGWFFDDISGIETVQVLMFAARAMQLARETFDIDLESTYLKMLEMAQSNVPELANGAKVYDVFVRPEIMDSMKIAAQNMILTLFRPNSNSQQTSTLKQPCCFQVSVESSEKYESGKFRLAFGKIKVHSFITLDEFDYECAAIWLGDHNVSCGVTSEKESEAFNNIKAEMNDIFEKGQINEIIQLMPKHFGNNIYSLKDMFKDDQRMILNQVIEDGIKKARELYQIVYHENSALMHFMNEIRVPTPKAFHVAVEVILNMEIKDLFLVPFLNLAELQRLIGEAKRLDIAVDLELLTLEVNDRINQQLKLLANSPENMEIIERASRIIFAVKEIPLHLNLWLSQNIAFKIAKTHYQLMKEKKDEKSEKWAKAFSKLCELIGIRLE